MSSYEKITCNIDGAVARIGLNNPQTLNALSQQMRNEIKAAIDALEADDAIRVVILAAEGRGFSSGTDLSEGLAGFATIEDQIQDEYKPVIMGIYNSSKLYIAQIHGACAGIAMGIALACDLAVMADNAFMYIPFAGLSMVPDGGISHQLVRHLGTKRAMQLYLEAARIQAPECLDYGLVNKVVAADQLAAASQAWAQVLAEGAPLAHRHGKRCLQHAVEHDLSSTIDLEASLQVSCSTSEDSQRAITAFFNKEKPVFQGR
ncbi:MAG: enoyl-CoA hydratase-related protein [Pseudomonadales bacterium]